MLRPMKPLNEEDVQIVLEAVELYQDCKNNPELGTRCVGFFKAMYPKLPVLQILEQLKTDGRIRMVRVPQHYNSLDKLDLHVELLHVA